MELGPVNSFSLKIEERCTATHRIVALGPLAVQVAPFSRLHTFPTPRARFTCSHFRVAMLNGKSAWLAFGARLRNSVQGLRSFFGSPARRHTSELLAHSLAALVDEEKRSSPSSSLRSRLSEVPKLYGNGTKAGCCLRAAMVAL